MIDFVTLPVEQRRKYPYKPIKVEPP